MNFEPSTANGGGSGPLRGKLSDALLNLNITFPPQMLTSGSNHLSSMNNGLRSSPAPIITTSTMAVATMASNQAHKANNLVVSSNDSSDAFYNTSNSHQDASNVQADSKQSNSANSQMLTVTHNGGSCVQSDSNSSNANSNVQQTSKPASSKLTSLIRIFKPWKWKRRKKSDNFKETSKGTSGQNI